MIVQARRKRDKHEMLIEKALEKQRSKNMPIKIQKAISNYEQSMARSNVDKSFAEKPQLTTEAPLVMQTEE